MLNCQQSLRFCWQFFCARFLYSLFVDTDTARSLRIVFSCSSRSKLLPNKLINKLKSNGSYRLFCGT
ncbi:hypothetical protein SSP1911 [Staphylococcus saprophyticus subsp. saprophyticus ATCC 15305]|uniref:Uncharacterized protein n=1 Tax=Staphylococcus saprophyticus subsp. saprophyticus (strain ATCC 15305 / DSM 20229 / NCIMB 8711 / NCTC 7292 / S-41) TaxID=342451 RepID=Q49W04_STAS1|nr:hypothetical protein SSP1911 [Staphylococcus saprophyticus subsp. saprophyticus ATCC 15305] [Staphylococcus saprophyticus subsp. saprophyticus ATCC 15305 = NCTC 7292]